MAGPTRRALDGVTHLDKHLLVRCTIHDNFVPGAAPCMPQPVPALAGASGHTPGAAQVAAYLEERVNVGVNFVLSAEIDHCRKDYKFGFGMTVGE